MVVIDFPPGVETHTEILFTTPGKTLTNLHAICTKAGVDFNSISIACAVPCLKAQCLGLSYSQYRMCSKYIENIPGNIIVTMGLIPLRAILGSPVVSVEAARNTTPTAILNNRNVTIVPTYSLRNLEGTGCGSCQGSDIKRTLMIKDLRHAAELIQ